MFTTLPESRAARQRRTGGFVLSTIAHAVLIALAVRATAWTAPTPEPLPKGTLVFLEPPPRQETPPTARPAQPDDARASGPAQEPAIPPAIVPTGEIPEVLPPPGAMSPLIRGDEFIRTSTPTLGGPATGSAALGGAPVYEEHTVDRAIVAIPGTTTPRYPQTLQAAGIEGDVRAQFVVDTLGRVEQGSVRILDATHDLFARAVRDALARARFVPAEAAGRKVRQLAEQSFSFRLHENR